jgi:hypothetical protein
LLECRSDLPGVPGKYKVHDCRKLPPKVVPDDRLAYRGCPGPVAILFQDGFDCVLRAFFGQLAGKQKQPDTV